MNPPFTAAELAEIHRRRDELNEQLALRSERKHFVYRAYDAEGRCLYVGCTNSPRRRRREHELDGAPWIADAVRCVMTGPLPSGDAWALESEQIRTLLPLHNKQRQRRHVAA